MESGFPSEHRKIDLDHAISESYKKRPQDSWLSLPNYATKSEGWLSSVCFAGACFCNEVFLCSRHDGYLMRFSQTSRQLSTKQTLYYQSFRAP